MLDIYQNIYPDFKKEYIYDLKYFYSIINPDKINKNILLKYISYLNIGHIACYNIKKAFVLFISKTEDMVNDKHKLKSYLKTLLPHNKYYNLLLRQYSSNNKDSALAGVLEFKDPLDANTSPLLDVNTSPLSIPKTNTTENSKKLKDMYYKLNNMEPPKQEDFFDKIIDNVMDKESKSKIFDMSKEDFNALTLLELIDAWKVKNTSPVNITVNLNDNIKEFKINDQLIKINNE